MSVECQSDVIVSLTVFDSINRLFAESVDNTRTHYFSHCVREWLTFLYVDRKRRYNTTILRNKEIEMSKSILTEWACVYGDVVTFRAFLKIGDICVRTYTICPKGEWFSDGDSVQVIKNADEKLLKQLCESDAHYFMSEHGWVRAKDEEEN